MVTDPPKERHKLHSGVVTAFEEAILSGALKVGDRLPSESEIARQHGVSTRTVREAVQVLETKGLVRRRHGERTEVVREDVGLFLDSLATTVRNLFSKKPDYLVDLMHVRRMFEVEAAGKLAAGGGHDDGRIEAALDAMQSAVENGSFPEYADADAAFHLAMVQSLDNEIFSTVYENLYGLIADVIRLSVRMPSKSLAEGLEEHRALFGAIRSGDPDIAREAIGTHLDNSTSYLKQALGQVSGATQKAQD